MAVDGGSNWVCVLTKIQFRQPGFSRGGNFWPISSEPQPRAQGSTVWEHSWSEFQLVTTAEFLDFLTVFLLF
jgi:hypothetical protein